MSNSQTSTLPPPPPSLTFGKGFCFTILCIVASLMLFSQSVQAEILAFENFQGTANNSIKGQGSGFGFSDTWNYTSEASPNVVIKDADWSTSSPTTLKKVLTTSGGGKGGGGYIVEFSNSQEKTWPDTIASRTLSNSIDFSQAGEYYITYNMVQWVKTNGFLAVGIGNGSTEEAVYAGEIWTSHSDAYYTKKNTGDFPGESGIAKVFSLKTSYTVLEKITVDGKGNNTVSYKVLTTNSTLPDNASDIVWDATKSFSSTGTYNRLEMRLNGDSGIYLQASEIRLGTTYGDVTGFLDNPQAGTSTGLAQRSIGLNFTGQNVASGSEKALATSDFAGADGYNQAMWNNIRLTNSSTSGAVQYAMFDNLGSMEYYQNQSSYIEYQNDKTNSITRSSMTVSYTTTSQSLDTLTGSDANTSLMSGHADGTTTVSLGNVPYNYYDVVVYMSDTDATTAGTYWITDSSGNKISDTVQFTPSAYDGTWKQSQFSGDNGNYYVFRGLTNKSIKLNSTDGAITAMQIVGHNSTMQLVTDAWSDELTIDGTAYTGVQFDSQTTTSTKSATHSGTVALNADGTFQIGNGYELTQSQAISGSGSLIKTGEGTLTLSSKNAYTGSTTINGGMLKLTGDGTLGTGSTTINYGILELQSSSTIYNLSGDSTDKQADRTINSFDDLILYSSDRTVTKYVGSIITTGKLIKQGNGDLQILLQAEGQVRAESFVLSSGRLDIKSAIIGDVADNYAALDASLDIQGGTFSPGNSVGAIKIAAGKSLIVEDGGKLLVEINSEGMDKIVFADADKIVDFRQGSILELTTIDGFTPSLGDDITETLYANIPGIQYALENKRTTLSSYYYQLKYDASGNITGVVVNPNAVPEPSTWALLILGFAGLMKVASCELRVARKRGRR